MFRLLSYNKCGGYRSEFRYCQDYDLRLRMIKLGRFFTVPKTLYHRYVQFDGVSYAPQKATEQWHYSIAAKRIAPSKPEEAAYLFSRLKNNGPTAVVGRSDPEIQRRALKATIRLVAWGRPQQARITANYISKPALRYLVQLMCSIAEHPGGALTLRWAASFVGVRNHDGFPG